MPDELMTTEQVARALGVSVKTLRRMVRDGRFPDAFPVSEGVLRWLAKDVEAYLHLRSRIGTRRLPPTEEAPEEIPEKTSRDTDPPQRGHRGETEGQRKSG